MGWKDAPTVAKWQQAPQADTRSGLMGKIDAFGRGVADMATFGGADELAAAANAVIPLDRLTGGKVKTVWETGDFGKAYNANVKQQRATDAYDERNSGGSRLAGQVLGAVAVPVPGASALKGGKFARAVQEGLIQGGLYGFGSGEDNLANRAKSAGINALAGGGSAGVGYGVVKGGARVLSPKIAPEVQQLASAGVTMTPGQRAGRGTIRSYAESIGKSIPGANVAIRSAERRGVEQFNKAWINEGLSPIGAKLPHEVQAGRPAVQWAQDAVSEAYDAALGPMVAHLDDATVAGWDRASQVAAQLPPQEAATFKFIAENKIRPLIPADGVVTGQNLQQIDRTLRNAIAGARNKGEVTSDLLADSLEELRATFLDSAARYSPEHLGAYQAANAAEANMNRVYDAASKAHGGGIFTPRQAAVSAAKRGYGTTKKTAAAGTSRMQGLADAAVKVLPDTIPNSGTPERQMAMSALGLGGTGTAYSLNPALAAPAVGVLPYIPGLDRLFQAAAMRNDPLRRAGTELGKRAYVGGMFGAPLGIAGNK